MKRNEQAGYAYKITVDYKSDKKRLVSWNFLDWILSQYPNALLYQKYVRANLFPLSRGEGNYTFDFVSEHPPLLFERSEMQVFNLQDLESPAGEKKVGAEYSGVTINSYDFLAAELGLRKVICLPEHLRVFPEAR